MTILGEMASEHTNDDFSPGVRDCAAVIRRSKEHALAYDIPLREVNE